MWKTTLIVAALVALIGCSRGTEESSTTPGGTSSIPTQAELDKLMAEGIEPIARRLAVGDYYLHYHLMRESDMFEALGSEQQAIAALRAVGEAHERNLRWGEQQAPRMIPASFTGEGMGAGMYGFGGGALVGAIASQLMQESGFDTYVQSYIEQMSDPSTEMPAVGTTLLESGEVTASGEGKFHTERTDINRDSEGNETSRQTVRTEADKDGIRATTETMDNKATIGIDKDGNLTIESDVKERGVEGKIKVRVRMDKCPDPQGKVTLTMTVNSRMRVSGKAGTGGSVHAEFEAERWLDDDARLINDINKNNSDLRLSMVGREGGRQTSFDVSTGARNGKETFTEHRTQGLSIFRPDEVDYANKAVAGIENYLRFLSELMMTGMGKGGPWESGRCVKLEVTTDPEKRTGADPGTAYRIEAKPRAAADGQHTGGTVRATLGGDSSLDPADTKVEADAKFEYANPKEKDKKASIDFEARSKRGVGKASVAFDTKKKGYVIGGCRLSGRVPDVDGPFDASVSGYNFHFTPSGEKAGTWRWSISDARGQGPYHITLDEDEQSGTLTLPPGKNVIAGQTLATEAWTCTLTAVKD